MESASSSSDANSSCSSGRSGEVEYQSFSELEDSEKGLPKKIKGRGATGTATMSSTEIVRSNAKPKKATRQIQIERRND